MKNLLTTAAVAAVLMGATPARAADEAPSPAVNYWGTPGRAAFSEFMMGPGQPHEMKALVGGLSLSIGVASIVVLAWKPFELASLSRQIRQIETAYPAGCPNGSVCLEHDELLQERAWARAFVISGAVGAGTSIGLWAFSRFVWKNEPYETAPRVSVRPVAGPGSVGLAGTF